ncbi:MAG: hypothetical protein JF590_01010 [Gemmatimonadetes bacterium]|nr:hypothetical protein [Gemmatimonadota bacterium]
MKALSAGYWVLGATILLAGCKSADDPATPWEIIHGTASLTASKAVAPTTHAEIVNYTGRSGKLTVADDSTVTGWRKIGADSAAVTGTVTFIGDSAVMTLTGLAPGEYAVITNGDFPTTYGLVSTAILTADITGDPATEQYRVYWQFDR